VGYTRKHRFLENTDLENPRLVYIRKNDADPLGTGFESLFSSLSSTFASREMLATPTNLLYLQLKKKL